MLANKGVRAIRRDVLRTINEAALRTYPNEFVAALRAEKGVIEEILLLPGTIQGQDSGTLQLHMLPIDYSVVGSVHSHPGYSNRPSDADLHFFEHFGYVHIITCLPFDETSWKAYNLRGERILLNIED